MSAQVGNASVINSPNVSYFDDLKLQTAIFDSLATWSAWQYVVMGIVTLVVWDQGKKHHAKRQGAIH